MDRTLTKYSLVDEHIKRVPLARGIGWGFLGGLIGTLVMDLLLMGIMLMIRQPAYLCFSIVGDTVARFFSITGIDMPGGIPTGIATHYSVGPLVGIIFGAAVAMFPALQEGKLTKYMIAAVLYIEILSQPLLATTPVLLKMTAPDTLQWFGGSFVMHLVMGIILGSIVGYGLRQKSPAAERRTR